MNQNNNNNRKKMYGMKTCLVYISSSTLSVSMIRIL